MKNYVELLEFPEILRKIKDNCISYLAKDQAAALAAFTSLDDLQEEHQRVNEAMDIIRLLGHLPMDATKDCAKMLKTAEMDGTLTSEEIYEVYHVLVNVEALKTYFASYEGSFHFLRDEIEGLTGDAALMRDIERCIEPDLTISDHASQELYAIRKAIARAQIHIRHEMERYLKQSKDALSLDSLAMRNDRLVLAVKATHRHEVRGLVHATSASGATLFVEPERVVTMNNELNVLKAQEQDEIQKILHRLTRRIKGDRVILGFDQEIMTRLDFLFAKATFGAAYDAVIPVMKKEGALVLKQARHPLIEQKQVVANDIIVDCQIMLITGSNTGGKTVTLKTAGLLSYMALCGLPVPCVTAEIPFFDAIYADIGDEQSIEQSLSTFSSHMSRIKDILTHITSHSLVLIDEIGSGTDPMEGSCLAQAIIDALMEVRCTVIASTHYGHLKTYAAGHPAMSVAAVGFDMEQMKPTYKLQLHTAGSSYAFEIADSLGLSHRIIAQAKRYKEESISAEEKLMDELKRREDQIAQQEERLAGLISEHKRLKETYERRLRGIENQKKQILENARVKANKELEDAKEMIDALASELRAQATLKNHHVTAAKHALDELKVEPQVEKKQQDHILKVGDHVRIDAMNREADIIDIGKNHAITVSLGGLNVQLKDHEVTFLHAPQKQQKVKAARTTKVKKTGHYEINVIGMRFVEAMETVDKFLDDALLMGYPSVRIVHGMGTGALRKGVRDLLVKKSFVKRYSDGGPNEGGLGATLVYFE